MEMPIPLDPIHDDSIAALHLEATTESSETPPYIDAESTRTDTLAVESQEHGPGRLRKAGKWLGAIAATYALGRGVDAAAVHAQVEHTAEKTAEVTSHTFNAAGAAWLGLRKARAEKKLGKKVDTLSELVDNAEVYRRAGQATLDKTKIGKPYSPISGFGYNTRGDIKAPPPPLETTPPNANSHSQTTAALRANLRLDASFRANTQAHEYISIYGHILEHPDQLEEELKTGRYTPAEAADMRRASAFVLRKHALAEKKVGRIEKQAEGVDIPGRVLDVRIDKGLAKAQKHAAKIQDIEDKQAARRLRP